MANYNKSVNFAVKDTLQTGDPDKIVSGAEIDTEFNNISSSSTSKVDKVSSATSGNIASLTATGNIQDSGQSVNTLVPTATIIMYAADTAPNGWLVCDGSPILRAQFPNLFNVIGEQFGEGDGSTTFNLPDLRDRMPLGFGNIGGTDANRVSNFDTNLADNGGSDLHVLSISELPSHDHDIHSFTSSENPAPNEAYDPVFGLIDATESGPERGGLTNTGGDEGHNNMPPFLAVNFIIKI